MRHLVEIGTELKAVEIHPALTRNELGEHWTAVLADYDDGDPIGWGDTPEEAVEDLKAEIEWRNE